MLFVPGLFGENAGHEEGAERGGYSPYQTTCIGMSTHR